MDFIKQVNSYEDICKILNADPTIVPDVSAYDDEDKAAAISTFRLWKASKAAWKFVNAKINYDNPNQRKWVNWFWLQSKKVGSGFSFCGCYFDASYSYVGARLSFPSDEIGQHIAKIMKDDWEAAMTIPEK